jgi:hypothetical protein
MRRESDTPYDYDGTYGDTSGRNVRTRRNINQRISVGNMDSGPGSYSQKYKDRSSSNDKSDYNVDESENEEVPVINKSSALFSPPINEKGGGIRRANYQQHDNPFDNVKTSNPQYQDYSPKKPSSINTKDNELIPSRSDEFQTPFNVGASPIGQSSTQDKRRSKFTSSADIAFDSKDGSDDSDDLRVLDSDDLVRGRNKDLSPHNRLARPRSSCIKKDWNREREPDIVSPKQVRFKGDSNTKIQPTNLDNRLNQQTNLYPHDVRTSYPDVRTSYPDDQVEYVREVSRAELQNKHIEKQNENLHSYNIGKRLRENERLNEEEIAYERSQIANKNNSYNPNPPKKNAMEQLVDHSIAAKYTRTTPTRSFQMKNVVNNTFYSREKLPDVGMPSNNTIPEMSARNEESNDESQYYRNTNTSVPRGNPRTRSPFNLTRNQNTSYVKENVEVRRSPARSHNLSSSNTDYYEMDDDTTVLHQKPSVHNISRDNKIRNRDIENYNRRSVTPPRVHESYNEPQRVHVNYNEPQRVHASFNEPQRVHASFNEPQRVYASFNEPQRVNAPYNEPNRGVHANYNKPNRVHAPYNEPQRVREHYNEPQRVREYYDEPQRVREHYDEPQIVREYYDEPQRVHQKVMPEEVYYVNDGHVSPHRSPARENAHRSPVRDNSHLQRSPRERPLGSPKREVKKHDSTTEDNIAFRFVTNKLLNKAVEDMVFKLIPEFFQEAHNPPAPVQQVVRKVQRVGSKPKEQRELMNVMKEMDLQDEDSDNDIDERINVAPVTASMAKKETQNKFVKKRAVDSMGIRFETNKKVNGVKGIAFQDKHNHAMIDVKSGVTRKRHEICDVWCSD